MNTFDLVVFLGLAVAVVTGFNTGLLRSAATILAYLFAMPIAVWVMSMAAPQEGGPPASPFMQNWVLFLAVFLVMGTVLGKFARMALDQSIGCEPASETGGPCPLACILTRGNPLSGPSSLAKMPHLNQLKQRE
jgi:hypothetical protein